MTEISTLLLKAASLMGIGMIAVFAFLSLLILAIGVLAKLAPASVEESSAPANAASLNQNQVANTSVIAAISAAVQQYRKAQQ